MPAIDPTLATIGPEWSIGSIEGVGTAGGAAPAGAEDSRFGGLLADQVGKLAEIQQEAAGASRELASGTATDPAATVMAIERARLSMQLASQIRTKGTEALQEIFRTSV